MTSLPSGSIWQLNKMNVFLTSSMQPVLKYFRFSDSPLYSSVNYGNYSRNATKGSLVSVASRYPDPFTYWVSEPNFTSPPSNLWIKI